MAKAKTVAKKRWFQMVVAKRRTKKPPHTGWRKKDPANVRRRKMLRAHHGKLLSAARACQALANVTKDPVTKRLARADARYFFSEYNRRKRRK
jgi:hypothetical protein